LTFAGDVVAEQSFAMPPATPHEFKALGETLPVYAGSVKAKGTILIKGRTPPGDYKVGGTLRFQECNDTICKVPQEVPFEIALKVEGMVPGLKK
jgi:hypothetical protein